MIIWGFYFYFFSNVVGISHLLVVERQVKGAFHSLTGLTHRIFMSVELVFFIPEFIGLLLFIGMKNLL